MFSWLSGNKKQCDVADIYNNVIDGLKQTYRKKLLPLEQMYLFGDFHSPYMNDGDFNAKPMVLLIGQYSTALKYSYVLVFEKPTKFQVRVQRVQSTNRLKLPPTLSLCILLLIFRLLLQSGDVEANPGPTLASILTLDDLNSVYKNLIKAAGNWFDLGLDLGLAFDILNNISDKHRDNQICLRDMIAVRLKTGPLTYSEICQSLRAPSVKQDVLAEAIEEACTGELDGIQESSTKRSSGLAVNSYSMEIPSSDLVHLASFFDCVDFLVDLLELTPAEKSDAMKKDNTSAQKAVLYCLSCWKKREPEKATFQALLDIVRKLKRGDIVRNIERYFHKNY